MNDATSPMPTSLKIVIGFFGLGCCWDLYVLTTGLGSTIEWVRLAIGIAIIVGLVRGNDSVRAIVRGLCVLGVIGGVIVTLRLVAFIGSGPASLVIPGLAAGVLAIAGSLFTFFVLGQERVETWMARRAFART